LPEIARSWHIQSSSSLNAGPTLQLVRTEAIQRQVIPVAGCPRTVMITKGSTEVVSPLLTEKEAARYLTRSVSSLRRGRRDGAGPKFLRIGRSIRYQRSQLDAYIDACEAGAAWEARHA